MATCTCCGREDCTRCFACAPETGIRSRLCPGPLPPAPPPSPPVDNVSGFEIRAYDGEVIGPPLQCGVEDALVKLREVREVNPRRLLALFRCGDGVRLTRWPGIRSAAGEE